MLTEEGKILFNRLLNRYYKDECECFYRIFGSRWSADEYDSFDYMPVKICRGINHKSGRIHTVVIWCDGSKTEVSQMNGDPDDAYTAFCAALAKKTFGSTSRTKKIMKEAIKNAGKITKEKKQKN